MKEYKQMDLDERKKLYVMQKNGITVKQIAQTLRRDKSTLYRELERNTKDCSIGYLPDEANDLAKDRKAQHGLKVNRYPAIKDIIIGQLKDGWSPEVIAGRDRRGASPFGISHEAIYQFIYSNEGKAHGLFKYLLKARPRRGMIYGRKPRTSLIPNRISIHDRPGHIATRKEFGHLEGDLTFFTNNQSMNIGVIVERKTRFTQLLLNNSKHTTVVMKNMFNKLAKLPKIARKSMTFDNGLEFARHSILKLSMDINTYFCDKHSPWQKGQVEQMNVMLHRYLPKNSNLKKVSYKQVELIQDKLNNRPRKCLRFKNPTEAFNEQLLKFVALRT